MDVTKAVLSALYLTIPSLTTILESRSYTVIGHANSSVENASG